MNQCKENKIMSAAQMNALSELAKVDEQVLAGMVANTCAMLGKKGLAEFRGYRNGKRVFAITNAGRAALSSHDHSSTENAGE